MLDGSSDAESFSEPTDEVVASTECDALLEGLNDDLCTGSLCAVDEAMGCDLELFEAGAIASAVEAQMWHGPLVVGFIDRMSASRADGHHLDFWNGYRPWRAWKRRR